VKWLFKSMKPSQRSSRPAEECYGAHGTQQTTLIHKICIELDLCTRGGGFELSAQRRKKGGRRSWGCSPEREEEGAKLRRTSPEQGCQSSPPVEKSRQDHRETVS
jgi:hypothetical protein